MIEALLRRLTRNWRPRTIRRDLVVDPPYLTRWYISKLPTMPDGSFPFDHLGRPRLGIVGDDDDYGVFLHRFGQDDDVDVHNHPWTWGLSFILVGGYVEERYDVKTKTFTTRILKAPAVNFIRHGDFHRVSLIGEQECWSIFFTGKRVSDWGFIHRASGRYYTAAQYFELH